ncbi:unnamed protein product [Paramecium sonneborni]|uniref:PB1 domain-containing protein n=1 Tax=Paramecium sonneborni TaxID=65129 RepID=A0A8S1QT14_9CILI|nr:unnamed protein product [Paramecium sonneborni]
MDIQIQYQGNISKYYGITTYENLIQEILQIYQTITDIELSYQDEEGDTIQVSNTSDLYAINDFQQVIIEMNARVDEEQQKNSEKEKKKQEMKQKKFLEQKQKKQHAIENEQLILSKMEQEFTQNLEQKQQELEILVQEQLRLEQYKTDPLPVFELALNESNLFDRIKEKEDQLLYIDDKKGFQTQLKTIQKEIHEIFHQIYEERKNQHLQNYKKWNQTKQSLIKNGEKIEKKRQKIKKYQDSCTEKLQNHRDKLQRLLVELEKLDDDTE